MDISRSGELMAALAASIARFSPLAWPIPIKVLPALTIIDFTSAKSTLMRAGVLIISAIP